MRKRSHQLSWLLRHGAIEAGLPMDHAGWATVADVLATSGLTREQLLEVVATNDKGRLQLDEDGDRVRACQGHSTAAMPVTADALEATWERVEVTTSLWHGTSTGAIDSIAATGLHPAARTHVHLAPAVDAKVGKRASVDLVLEVSPARLAAHGLPVFRAPNGVLLVRAVPAGAVVGLRATSERGRSEIDRARALFGLASTLDPG